MAENQGTSESNPVGYEIIEYRGQEARRYPNGVIRSNKGYILHMPSEVAKSVKAEQIRRGQESAQDALRHGTRSETPEEGWGKVIMKVVDRAMQDKNGRVANDAARLLGLATGFMSRDSKVEVDGQVLHRPVLPELPPKYMEYLKKLAERDIVEGRVLDDDDDRDDD